MGRGSPPSDTQFPWLANTANTRQPPYPTVGRSTLQPHKAQDDVWGISIMQCQVIGDSANWCQYKRYSLQLITCFMYVCMTQYLIVSVHTCEPDSGASYTCLWYSWKVENFNIGNMTNMSHCTGTHTCVCISAGTYRDACTYMWL